MPVDIYRTLSEQIANQLRNEILSGQLVENEPLPGEKLAKRFSVSRGPIRDALLQLTHEGLVVSEPNTGFKVSCGPSDQFRPIVLEMRKQLETFVVRIAFGRLTDADIRHLGEILDVMRVAAERDDRVTFVEHDTAFHRVLIEHTGDKDLLLLWRSLAFRMMLRYSAYRTLPLKEVFSDHVVIYEAIKARDEEATIKSLSDSFK